LRLFAALELPEDVVAALAGWGRACERPGLRVLPPASLHVTLAFLGERPDEDADAIGEAVVACAAPAPGLSLGAPAWLGRGSALAVDLDDADGACERLQGAVSDALVALGAFAPEARAFRPHVTVARVRSGARVARRGLPEPPACGPFAGAALTLFRSKLSPRGAQYLPLARADLPR
jgi:RNA 2',3'-cyclic 3'-phosphodiesterase